MICRRVVRTARRTLQASVTGTGRDVVQSGDCDLDGVLISGQLDRPEWKC